MELMYVKYINYNLFQQVYCQLTISVLQFQIIRKNIPTLIQDISQHDLFHKIFVSVFDS